MREALGRFGDPVSNCCVSMGSFQSKEDVEAALQEEEDKIKKEFELSKEALKDLRISFIRVMSQEYPWLRPLEVPSIQLVSLPRFI